MSFLEPKGLEYLSRGGHSRINAQGHLNLCSISEPARSWGFPPWATRSRSGRTARESNCSWRR